jgi:hypothetical protein
MMLPPEKPATWAERMSRTSAASSAITSTPEAADQQDVRSLPGLLDPDVEVAGAHVLAHV